MPFARHRLENRCHPAGDTYWALTDRQGTVADVLDSAGKLRVHTKYDSFGNAVGQTHYSWNGSTVTSGPNYIDEAFAYTGRWFDKDTGLQNNLNRWYDPTIGRWLSEDPIGFEADEANLYRYVGNSPLNGRDPSGLASPGPGYGALPNPFWPPDEPKRAPAPQPAPAPKPQPCPEIKAEPKPYTHDWYMIKYYESQWWRTKEGFNWFWGIPNRGSKWPTGLPRGIVTEANRNCEIRNNGEFANEPPPAGAPPLGGGAAD